VAHAANVKTLVLSHFLEQIDQPGLREHIVRAIAKTFTGNIVWGEDLMEVPVKGPRMFRME
jgi:ribonuclease BN (tRNA processing enzyme)